MWAPIEIGLDMKFLLDTHRYGRNFLLIKRRGSCGTHLLVAHHLKDLIFQRIQWKRLFLDARLVCGGLFPINFFDVNPDHSFEANIRAFIGAFLFLLFGFPTGIKVVIIG